MLAALTYLCQLSTYQKQCPLKSYLLILLESGRNIFGVLDSFSIGKMGSYRKAVMTGFICRLCSEQKKNVIHFYSRKAKEMGLLEKIKLLPITVDKYDNLPKTICNKCIERLTMQYNLVQKIRKTVAIERSHRLFHSNGRCPVECPLHRLTERQPPIVASSDVEEEERIIDIINSEFA